MTRRQWKARRFPAFAVRALAFVLPIAAAVVVAILVASLLPEPSGLGAHLGWWSAVIGSSLLAMFAVELVARKLLPLAVLLRLSLVFPDQAPSRFRLALRSGSTGQLHSQVAAARSRGADTEPLRAAEFVLTLVAALGAHDRKTRGHAERTRAYTDLLAEELGLGADDQERLRWAALLHDVGKMAIQADVLNKDGNLEEIEWAEIRHHPADGYELSRPLHEFLGGWEETILHHHEKWDGSGYPFGLTGEDIAFGARIVAVADAYDAMTALRSYQPAMSSSAARQELASSAGVQFDPLIVRAFLNLSMGSLRKVMGLWTVLAQIPFIGGFRRVGETAGLLAATVVSVLGFTVVGLIPSPGIGLFGDDGGLLAAGSAGDGGVITVDVPTYLAELDPMFLTPLPGSEGRTIDPAAIDVATIAILQPPASGTAAVVGSTIVYTPGATFGGSDSMSFSACDTVGACVEAPLVFTTGGIEAPVLVAAGGAGTEDGASSGGTGGAAEGTGGSGSGAAGSGTGDSSGGAGSGSTSTGDAGSGDAGSATSTTTAGTGDTQTSSTSSTSSTSTTTAAPAGTTSTTTAAPAGTTSTTSTTTTTTTTTSTTSTTTTTSTTSTTSTTTTTSTTSTTSTTTTTTTTAAPDPAPTAVDDAATTDEDTAVMVDVLENDAAPGSALDPSSLTVVVAPAAGATAVAGGDIFYTPDQDQNGTDGFVYRVCNTAGRCATAAVTVTVVPVADAPVVRSDPSATFEDTALTIDVLANDTDPDDDLDISSVVIVAPPATGSVTVSPDGSVVYVPDLDTNGVDGFSYEVCDLTGLCGSAPVSIVVVPVNDNPVAIDDEATGPPGVALEIDVLANDYDPDGESPVISSAPSTSALGGQVLCGDVCTYVPPENWVEVDTFTYTISDGNGATAGATVTIVPEASDVVLYLRAGGAGDQSSTPVLPMTNAPGPTNATLPNYDVDRDDQPGLFLLQAAGGAGTQLAEQDPARYQLWSMTVASDLVLTGTAELRLHAATANFEPGLAARVSAFLLDCAAPSTDGTDCTELSRAFVDRDPWSTVGGGFEEVVIAFGAINERIVAGHSFAIKVTVAGPNSDDDMHFAFDADGYLMEFRAGEVVGG